MTYEVIVTSQANADLRGIYEYIAFELLSPGNAAGQLDRLEKYIMGLGDNSRRNGGLYGFLCFRCYYFADPGDRAGLGV